MTRVSNLARLFCTFILAAQVRAANLPLPLQPDKRPTVRPSPILDPIPIACTKSTVSIGCGSMYTGFLILSFFKNHVTHLFSKI